MNAVIAMILIYSFTDSVYCRVTLTHYVIDSKTGILWSINNMAICKMTSITARTFKGGISLSLGRLENSGKPLLFLLEQSNVHIISPQSSVEYVQCISLEIETAPIAVEFVELNTILLLCQTSVVVYKLNFTKPSNSTRDPCKFRYELGSRRTFNVSPMLIAENFAVQSKARLLCFNRAGEAVVINLQRNTVDVIDNLPSGIVSMSWSGEKAKYVQENEPCIVKEAPFIGHSLEMSAVRDIITLESHQQLRRIYAVPGADFCFFFTRTHEILMHSTTRFAVSFLTAVQAGYKSIGYISRSAKANEAVRPTQQQTLDELSKCSEFFSSWDKKMKTMTGKTSVRGANGAIISEVTDCIASSNEAIKININRLEALNCSNMDKVKLYTCLNESPIEHGFGIISSGTTAGSMYDFAVGQRRAQTDMVLKYVDAFSKPHQYRKRYFDMPGVSKMDYKSLDELRESVYSETSYSAQFTVTSLEQISRNNPEIVKDLAVIFNTAKAQPRRTNRAKWKEEAGFRPQMLSENDPRVLFKKNDVLCYELATGEIGFLSVEKDVPKLKFLKTNSVVGFVLIRKKQSFTVSNNRISVTETSIIRDAHGHYCVCHAKPTPTLKVVKLSEDFLDSLPLSAVRDIFSFNG